MTVGHEGGQQAGSHAPAQGAAGVRLHSPVAWREDLPAQTRDRLVALCAGLGAWGVVSGFALFVLLYQRLGEHSPLVFLLALAVAALVAALTEYLSERVEHGQGKGLRRLPATILMLALFELFVTAWHGASEMGREQVMEAGLVVLGDDLRDALGAGWALGAVAILWTLEGAVLGGVLGARVFATPTAKPEGAAAGQPGEGPGSWGWLRPTGRSALAGGLWGAAAGAVGVLLAVLVVRTVAVAHLMLFDRPLWIATLHGMAGEHTSWILSIPLRVLEWITTLGKPGSLTPLVAIAGVVYLCKQQDAWWPVWALGLPLAWIIVGPVLSDFMTVLAMTVLGGIIWAIPGALLGAAVPLLKGPAARPQFWSAAALVAMVLLGCVTLLRFHGEYLAVEVTAAVLVGLAAVVFWYGGALDTYWPLAALVLAVLVAVATTAQQATFRGVLMMLLEVTGRRNPVGPAKPGQENFLERIQRLKEFHPVELPPWTNWTPLTQPGPATGPLSPPASRPFPDLLRPWSSGQPSSGPSSPPAPGAGPGGFSPGGDEPLRGFHGLAAEPVDERTRLNLQMREADTLQREASHDLARDWSHEVGRAKTVEGWVRQLEEREKELEHALETYRESKDRQFTGDPSTWPEHRAQVLLRRLMVTRHRLERRKEELETGTRNPPEPAWVAATFEVAVTSSLAFWVTVGLLVSWSARQVRPEGSHAS